MATIDYALLKYLSIISSIVVKVRTDYKSVIDTI